MRHSFGIEGYCVHCGKHVHTCVGTECRGEDKEEK